MAWACGLECFRGYTGNGRGAREALWIKCDILDMLSSASAAEGNESQLMIDTPAP